MNTQLVNMAFSNHTRNKLVTFNDAVKFLWGQGLINVGELAEKAIVKKSKKKLKQNKKNAKGSDFKDKSDSKYVTVTYYKNYAYATINSIQNKIGMLRVMIHEPKTNKNYFFRIPYKVYAPYRNANNSIKIYFDQQGNPRRPTRKNVRYDLWDHRCSSEEWAK
jgi:hypothetical protein